MPKHKKVTLKMGLNQLNFSLRGILSNHMVQNFAVYRQCWMRITKQLNSFGPKNWFILLELRTREIYSQNVKKVLFKPGDYLYYSSRKNNTVWHYNRNIIYVHAMNIIWTVNIQKCQTKLLNHVVLAYTYQCNTANKYIGD